MIKRNITKKFNVLRWDFNKERVEQYDVLPMLADGYRNRDRRKWNPVRNEEELREFVRKECAYYFRAKCEAEILVLGLPCSQKDPLKDAQKVDIYEQVMMNFDLLIDIFKEYVTYDK